MDQKQVKRKARARFPLAEIFRRVTEKLEFHTEFARHPVCSFTLHSSFFLLFVFYKTFILVFSLCSSQHVYFRCKKLFYLNASIFAFFLLLSLWLQYFGNFPPFSPFLIFARTWWFFSWRSFNKYLPHSKRTKKPLRILPKVISTVCCFLLQIPLSLSTESKRVCLRRDEVRECSECPQQQRCDGDNADRPQEETKGGEGWQRWRRVRGEGKEWKWNETKSKLWFR